MKHLNSNTYLHLISRLNRAALHELEYDKANKFMALQIDESAHSMHNGSAFVSLYDGVECIDQT